MFSELGANGSGERERSARGRRFGLLTTVVAVTFTVLATLVSPVSAQAADTTPIGLDGAASAVGLAQLAASQLATCSGDEFPGDIAAEDAQAKLSYEALCGQAYDQFSGFHRCDWASAGWVCSGPGTRSGANDTPEPPTPTPPSPTPTPTPAPDAEDTDGGRIVDGRCFGSRRAATGGSDGAQQAYNNDCNDVYDSASGVHRCDWVDTGFECSGPVGSDTPDVPVTDTPGGDEEEVAQDPTVGGPSGNGPLLPTGLSAIPVVGYDEAVNPDGIRVSWSAGGGPESIGFNISRAEVDGDDELTYLISIADRSWFVDCDVEAGKTYRYTVSAWSEGPEFSFTTTSKRATATVTPAQCKSLVPPGPSGENEPSTDPIFESVARDVKVQPATPQQVKIVGSGSGARLQWEMPASARMVFQITRNGLTESESDEQWGQFSITPGHQDMVFEGRGDGGVRFSIPVGQFAPGDSFVIQAVHPYSFEGTIEYQEGYSNINTRFSQSSRYATIIRTSGSQTIPNFLSTLGTSQAPPGSWIGDRDDWNSVAQFSDNFDGSGKLADASNKWYFARSAGVDDGPRQLTPSYLRDQRQTDERAVLANGKLEMTARISDGTYSYIGTADDGGNGYKVDPTNGVFVEASVRLDQMTPADNAWWAFWLMAPGGSGCDANGDPVPGGSNAYDGHAKTGTEIDLFEFVPDLGNGFNQAVFRYEGGHGENCSSPGAAKLAPGGRNFTYEGPRSWPEVNMPQYMDGHYHRLGMYYAQDCYAVYIDDELLWQVTEQSNPGWITPTTRESIRLSWEIQNSRSTPEGQINNPWTSRGGSFSNTALDRDPKVFIDYVNVWEKKESANGLCSGGADPEPVPEVDPGPDPDVDPEPDPDADPTSEMAAPTGVVATASPGAVTVTWDAGDGVRPDGYDVTRNGEPYWSVDEATFVDETVVAGESYTYAVTPWLEGPGGNQALRKYGDISDEVSATAVAPDPDSPVDPVDPVDPEDPTDPVDPENPTDPNDPSDPADPGPTSEMAAPGGLAPAPSPTSITLSWNAGDGVRPDGYDITRNDEPFWSVNDTVFVDETVVAGETYRYKVTPWIEGPGGDQSLRKYGDVSDEVSVTAAAPDPDIPVDPNEPGIPTGLEAVVDGQSVKLSWSAATGPVEGYQVLRRAGSGSYRPVATIVDGSLRWTDTTVNLTTYVYAIRSFTAPRGPDLEATYSAYSESVEATPTSEDPSDPDPENFGPIGVPTDVAATVVGPSVHLSWTDSSGPVFLYRVFRDGSEVPGSPIRANSFVDNRAEPGEAHSYQIQGIGQSPADGEAATSGLSAPASATIPVDAEPVLEGLAFFLSASATFGAIRLSGSKLVAIEGYDVYRDGELYESLPAVNPEPGIGGFPSLSRTILTDEDVTPGVTYDYYVTPWATVDGQRRYGATTSSVSVTAAYAPGDDPFSGDPDLAPVELTTEVRNTVVRLSWNRTNAEGYRVVRRLVDPVASIFGNLDNYQQEITYTTETELVDLREFTDVGLEFGLFPETDYTYEVRAYKGTNREYGEPATVQITTGEAAAKPAEATDVYSFSEIDPQTQEATVTVQWRAPEGWDTGDITGYRIHHSASPTETLLEADMTGTAANPDLRSYTFGPVTPDNFRYDWILAHGFDFTIQPYRMDLEPVQGPTSVSTLSVGFWPGSPVVAPLLDPPQGKEHPSYATAIDALFPNATAERRAVLTRLFWRAHDRVLNGWQVTSYHSDETKDVSWELGLFKRLLALEGYEPPAVVHLDLALAIKSVTDDLGAKAAPSGLAAFIPGQRMSGDGTLFTNRSRLGSLSSKGWTKEGRSNRYFDNLPKLEGMLEALPDPPKNPNQVEEIEILAFEQAAMLLDVWPGKRRYLWSVPGHVDSGFHPTRRQEIGSDEYETVSAPTEFSRLWNAASREDRLAYYGFDVTGWDLAMPYVTLSKDMDRIQDDLEDWWTPLIKGVIGAAIAYVTGGAASAAYASYFGVAVTSLGATAFGAAVGSFVSTFFMTDGDLSAAVESAWRGMLGAGFAHYTAIPVADRSTFQVFAIAIIEGGLARINGQSFQQALLESLGRHYVPGLASFLEKLENVSPFVAGLGGVLVKSYIDHGGDWDQMSGDLEQYAFDYAGEGVTNYVGTRLEAAEWGSLGGHIADLAGLAVSSQGRREEFEEEVFRRLGAEMGENVRKLFGDSDSFGEDLTAHLIETYLTAQGKPDDQIAKFFDDEMSRFIFERAGQKFSDEAKGLMTSANGGQTSPLIDSLAGLINVAVANSWKSRDQLESAVTTYVANELKDAITAAVHDDCSPAWVNGLTDRLVDSAVDAAISGDSDQIGQNVGNYLVGTLESGQLDNAASNPEACQSADDLPDAGTGGPGFKVWLLDLPQSKINPSDAAKAGLGDDYIESLSSTVMASPAYPGRQIRIDAEVGTIETDGGPGGWIVTDSQVTVERQGPDIVGFASLESEDDDGGTTNLPGFGSWLVALAETEITPPGTTPVSEALNGVAVADGDEYSSSLYPDFQVKIGGATDCDGFAEATIRQRQGGGPWTDTSEVLTAVHEDTRVVGFRQRVGIEDGVSLVQVGGVGAAGGSRGMVFAPLMAPRAAVKQCLDAQQFKDWLLGPLDLPRQVALDISGDTTTATAREAGFDRFSLVFADDEAFGLVVERNSAGIPLPSNLYVGIKRNGGGHVIGFGEADIPTLFDSLVSVLTAGANEVLGSYIAAMSGCAASLDENLTAMKSAFLELWRSDSILGYLADQWEAIQEIIAAFIADPAAFFEQFLKDLLRADEFTEGNRDRWAGMILCDIALGVVLAGIGGAAAGTFARLFARLPEIRAFKNDPDRNPDSVIGKPCNSFPTGTLVLMADGSRLPIDQIQPGDRVLAADEETGVWSSREVLDQWSHLDDGELATVSLADGSQVSATDDHKFWVDSDGRWVALEDVQPGDFLLTPHGVTEVASVDVSGPAQRLVWELDVAVDDTFTVHTGTQDVLVHNAKCPISEAEVRDIERDFGPLNPVVVDVSNARKFEGAEKPPEARDLNGNWVGGWQHAPSPANWLGEIYDLGAEGYAYEINDFVVLYNLNGYPDFSAYAIASVDIGPFTGSRTGDFKAANVEIDRPDFGNEAPEGYTWHHVEATHIEGTTMTDGGGVMELVDEQVHSLFSHSGGVSTTR
jgi:hypothetical protein